MTMFFNSNPYTTYSATNLPRHERLFAILFCSLSFSVIFRLTILVRRRSAESFSNIDSMALIQLAIVGLCLILLPIAPRLKGSWKKMSYSGSLYIIMYYMLAIFSTLWSGMPKYTAYRAIEFLTLFYAMYLFIFYTPTYLKAETKVLFAALVIMFLDVGKHIKLGGLSLGSLHTNTYSAIAAMLTCYCTAEFFGAKTKKKTIVLHWHDINYFFGCWNEQREHHCCFDWSVYHCFYS